MNKKSKSSFGDQYYQSYIKGVNMANYKSQQEFKKKYIPQRVENGHFKEKFEFYLKKLHNEDPIEKKNRALQSLR